MENIDESIEVLDDDDDIHDGSDLEEWDLDEDILNRLKQNDRTIEKLFIRFNTDDDDEEDNNFSDANDIDWEQEGVSAISENTYIKSLSIYMWHDEEDDDNAMYAYEENAKLLLRAVSNNRSIRHFTMNGDIVDSGDMMEALSPCFRHNDVLSFEVDSFYLTARSASLMGNALSKGRSLRKLELDSIYGNGKGEEAASKLVSGLELHSNLKELKLSFHTKDSTWCNMLQHSLSKLEVLTLDYSFIDKKGAIALGSGLGNITRLRNLSLRGIRSITSAGWLAIFKGLRTSSNSSLEELALCLNRFDDDASASLAKIKSLRYLDLSGARLNSWGSLLTPLLTSTSVLEKLLLSISNIDDEGLTGLVDALSINSSLRELIIGENRSITREGLAVFIRYLGNPSSLLEHVDLSGRHTTIGIINDDLVYTLANVLCTNTKLKRLHLTNNQAVTPTGWQTFFETLRNSNLSLEELILSCNNIDDNVVESIVNVSASLCSLKVLRLSAIRLITPVGLRTIATLLQQPNSCLSELYVNSLNDEVVNDEVVVNFANLLIGNLHLKSLYLGGFSHNLPLNVSARGWDALANTLCDQNGIESIFDSNHTLQRALYSNCEHLLPPDLATFLTMNENDNKFEVARQKIIQYHFLNGEDNMQEFVDMELGVLPHAMGWTGRNDTGHSLLYQLVRCMPTLFDSDT